MTGSFAHIRYQWLKTAGFCSERMGYDPAEGANQDILLTLCRAIPAQGLIARSR
jgi:hypothetical protein